MPAIVSQQSNYKGFCMEKYSEKLAKILDFILFGGSVIVIGAWAIGSPLFYNPNGPVMSIFTAISLFFYSWTSIGYSLFSALAFHWKHSFVNDCGRGKSFFSFDAVIRS